MIAVGSEILHRHRYLRRRRRRDRLLQPFELLVAKLGETRGFKARLEIKDVDEADGRCQLSRPWYSRCVGGAAAWVGRSFARPLCCPALTERGRKKAR